MRKYPQPEGIRLILCNHGVTPLRSIERYTFIVVPCAAQDEAVSRPKIFSRWVLYPATTSETFLCEVRTERQVLTPTPRGKMIVVTKNLSRAERFFVILPFVKGVPSLRRGGISSSILYSLFMTHYSSTYSVESVTSGHPDKVCDQISDAILDACLAQDPRSRVAVESFGAHGLLVVAGEVSTRAEFDPAAIARKVYRDIGYENELEIVTRVVRQSPDIAQGVDTGGAGDQGIMYGYATFETPEFLPKAVVLAHALAKGLENLRRTDARFSWVKPDGKTQVTMENGRVKTVLVSTQHDAATEQDFIRDQLIEYLIDPIVYASASVSVESPPAPTCASPMASARRGLRRAGASVRDILVNPTGRFVQGGFDADTGLTGRKIMVDTYGGLIPHGGGCFSGKDPTKVDRSAAYMARFAAKNIVANGFAKECLVSVAYAIGKAEPLMVEFLNEKGESMASVVKKNFDFRPAAIMERLNLRRPIYLQTAAYGHFGKLGLPWEEVVKIS